MPKGVPLAGFRVRKSETNNDGKIVQFTTPKVNMPMNEPVYSETDEQIESRLNNAFEVLSLMSQAVCDGKTKSLIVSGAPGLGKSFTVEDVVKKHGEDLVGYCKGYTRPTGIYKMLHEYQFPHNVVVFDDCDSAFGDEASLNLLKAACDTLDTRRLNWGTETNMVDKDGVNLPRNFDYNGSVIFITNLDFEQLIAAGNKLSPHLEALMSRSHYINLGMRSKRERMIRIKQVLKAGLLRRQGVNDGEEGELMSFIHENTERFRELDLRMVIKAGQIFKSYPNRWQDIAKATLFRGKM